MEQIYGKNRCIAINQKQLNELASKLDSMKLVYKADMHRIQQIVMNIARNAINDASAESSISLKLKINK